jgi:hypothetical protein
MVWPVRIPTLSFVAAVSVTAAPTRAAVDGVIQFPLEARHDYRITDGARP